MRNVEVKYLVRDGARIAYEIFGSGPIDLIVNSGAQFPIDLMWDLPQLADFMDQLGRVARVIVYDRRGTGASDPLPTTDGAAGLESSAADHLAVLDAVGTDRASILDFTYGAVTIFIAVSYPQRVRSIIVQNLRSSFPEIRDLTEEERKETAVWLGTTEGLQAGNPRVAHDLDLQRWWGRAHRLNASPEEEARSIELASKVDVESLLEHVKAPTLVFHRHDTHFWNIESSRETAARIPRCRFVELPGSETDLYLGDTVQVLEEITRFLRDEVEMTIDDNRLLATVLFTDIVSSTEHLAAVGDRRWRQLLDHHDGFLDRIVPDYRGRVVKKLGDGVLATFDGPARAVRCAAAVRDAMSSHGVAVRAGLHTGEVELRDGDLSGMAVHMAGRICSLAGPGEILVSRTVTDLTGGSGITFDPRGQHELKGIPGRWPLSAARVPSLPGPISV